MKCRRSEHPCLKHKLDSCHAPAGVEESHCTAIESKKGDEVMTWKIPPLMEDDISAIGAWYLAESVSVHPLDSRRDAHHLWGLALWDLAIADATLFGCVALLTLQKKRTIATAYNRVVYLDYKQKVYQGLSKALKTNGSKIHGGTALTMTLLSFVEVLEGNFGNARSHIHAVAAMDFVRHLNEVQWRLIIWNDLRYAMKLVILPALCYYIPTFLAVAAAEIESDILAEARRLAFGNLKHLRKLPEVDEHAWFSLLVSMHTIDILVSRPASASHHTRLLCAYQAEYRAHTIAAELSAKPTPDPITTLVIHACQLHILAVTSSFAPSTVECREILLSRARSVLVNFDCERDVNRSRTQLVPTLWSLSTFAAHIMDGGFNDRQFFIQNLAATVESKRLHSRASFVQILRSWPWVDSWHQSRVSAVWEEVLVGRGRRWRCIASNDHPNNCIEKRSERYYAGILLFYES